MIAIKGIASWGCPDEQPDRPKSCFRIFCKTIIGIGRKRWKDYPGGSRDIAQKKKKGLVYKEIADELSISSETVPANMCTISTTNYTYPIVWRP